jgi:hypothetical protein
MPNYCLASRYRGDFLQKTRCEAEHIAAAVIVFYASLEEFSHTLSAVAL